MFAQLDGFEWTRFTAYTDVQNTSPTLTNPFFSVDLNKMRYCYQGEYQGTRPPSCRYLCSIPHFSLDSTLNFSSLPIIVISIIGKAQWTQCMEELGELLVPTLYILYIFSSIWGFSAKTDPFSRQNTINGLAFYIRVALVSLRNKLNKKKTS